MSKQYRYIRLENIDGFDGWDLEHIIPAKSPNHYTMAVICKDDEKQNETMQTKECQKAEIERLKANLSVELENFASEYDNKIKAEAIKEFAERLEPLKKFRSCMATSEYELSVTMREVDAVKKEMLKEVVGEADGQ